MRIKTVLLNILRFSGASWAKVKASGADLLNMMEFIDARLPAMVWVMGRFSVIFETEFSMLHVRLSTQD